MFPSYADAAIRAMEPRVKAGRAHLADASWGWTPASTTCPRPGPSTRSTPRAARWNRSHSICGAIPSAEANTNPWGYKLSWAPESLIGASRRTARILVDGKVVEWPDGATYEHVHLEEVAGMGWYQVYANSDSLPYLETYAIPECREHLPGHHPLRGLERDHRGHERPGPVQPGARGPGRAHLRRLHRPQVRRRPGTRTPARPCAPGWASSPPRPSTCA